MPRFGFYNLTQEARDSLASFDVQVEQHNSSQWDIDFEDDVKLFYRDNRTYYLYREVIYFKDSDDILRVYPHEGYQSIRDWFNNVNGYPGVKRT